MAAARTTTTKATDPAKDDTEADPFADQIEIKDGTVTIKFRDSTFHFPDSRAKWPTRAVQAFQRGKNMDGVELLLGPKQWDALNEVAPAVEDFWEFTLVLQAASVRLESASG